VRERQRERESKGRESEERESVCEEEAEAKLTCETKANLSHKALRHRDDHYIPPVGNNFAPISGYYYKRAKAIQQRNCHHG
jgi:hypothetical protein